MPDKANVEITYTIECPCCSQSIIVKENERKLCPYCRKIEVLVTLKIEWFPLKKKMPLISFDRQSLCARVRYAETVEKKLIDEIRKLGVREQERLLEQLKEKENA